MLVGAALAVGLPLGRLGDAGKPRLAPPVAPIRPAPASTPVRMDGDGAVVPAQVQALAALLRSRNDMVRDVLFLLAGGLRDRCNPAHAHELARMAVIARLPVLEGMSDALAGQPALRSALYVLVRQLVATAPCTGPLRIDAGGYAMDLDPETYARHFPDSYFDPGLDAAPPDIAGQSLDARLADPCTPLAYGVLPPGDQRAWVCTNLRANLRKRALAACDASLRGSSGLAGPQPLPADVAMALAETIHRGLAQLPAMCQ